MDDSPYIPFQCTINDVPVTFPRELHRIKSAYLNVLLVCDSLDGIDLERFVRELTRRAAAKLGATAAKDGELVAGVRITPGRAAEVAALALSMLSEPLVRAGGMVDRTALCSDRSIVGPLHWAIDLIRPCDGPDPFDRPPPEPTMDHERSIVGAVRRLLSYRPGLQNLGAILKGELLCRLRSVIVAVTGEPTEDDPTAASPAADRSVEPNLLAGRPAMPLHSGAKAARSGKKRVPTDDMTALIVSALADARQPLVLLEVAQATKLSPTSSIIHWLPYLASEEVGMIAPTGSGYEVTEKGEAWLRKFHGTQG